MKNFIFIGLFYYLCIFNWGFALYSRNELLIYNVFLKPFGINFNESIILKVSPDFGKCADLKKSFEICNSTSTKLASSINASELSKLESLSKSCPSGSYSCFHNTVKSDEGLKGWFKKVQTIVKSLCELQCWKTTQLFTNSSCIHSTGQSTMKESDMRYIQFVNDALNSLCIQHEKSSCADKFINGLLKNSSDSDIQVCNVRKNIEDNKCLTACYRDLSDFYDSLECCTGSVTSIMDCYNVKPQEGSYGVFVKESYARCHLLTPHACSSSPKCPFTPPPPQSSSESPVSSSSKGKEIVGICVAVLICTGLALIVGNYMYRRFKKKQAIRFEDYGYSRLKMLEDDFYYDVEDDETTGLMLQA